MYRLLDHSWSPRIQKGHLVTCFGMDNSQNLYIGHARANTNGIRIIFVHIVIPSAVYTMSRFSRTEGKSSCAIRHFCDDVTSRDEGPKSLNLISLQSSCLGCAGRIWKGHQDLDNQF